MSEDRVEQLQREVSETRAKRLAAQRKALHLPVVQKAVDRLERDRSSGITLEVNEARSEIQLLNDNIMDLVHGVDLTRRLFNTADKQYPQNSQRAQIIPLFNIEARWRDGLISDERWAAHGSSLPNVQEIF